MENNVKVISPENFVDEIKVAAKRNIFYYHHFKAKYLEQPFSTIYYEDRIAYEVPFPDAIDENLDFYLPALKKYCSQNLGEDFEQKFSKMIE